MGANVGETVRDQRCQKLSFPGLNFPASKNLCKLFSRTFLVFWIESRIILVDKVQRLAMIHLLLSP